MKLFQKAVTLIVALLIMLLVSPIDSQAANDTYSITFKANLSYVQGTMSDMTGLSTGTTYTLTANAYSRTGCIFKEWNTKADGTGTSYKDGASVKGLGSGGEVVTLYAQWDYVYYTITFELNGGENHQYNIKKTSYKVTDGEISIYPASKEGYGFAGWTMTGDKSMQCMDDRYVIYAREGGDRVLTATYKDVDDYRYRITFDGNGATSGSMADEYIYDDRVNSFSRPMSCGYKYPGYMVKEWNTKADGTGTKLGQYTSLSGMPREFTCYAIWTLANVNITFDCAGPGINSIFLDRNNPSKALPTPTKNGYEFLGWFDTPNGGTQLKTHGDVEAYFPFGQTTVKLYAIWKGHSGGNNVHIYTRTVMDSEITWRVMVDSTEIPADLKIYTRYRSFTPRTEEEFEDYILNQFVYRSYTITLLPAELNERLYVKYTAPGATRATTVDCSRSFDGYIKDSTKPEYNLADAARALGVYAKLYFGDESTWVYTEDREAAESRVSAVTADELAGYKAKISGTDDRVIYVGSSLMLEDSITIRHYFKLAEGTNIKDIKVTVASRTAKVKENANGYYVEISDIKLDKLADYFVTKIGGIRIQYGVLSYAYKVLSNSAGVDENLVNMMKAFYMYNVELKKYKSVQ